MCGCREINKCLDKLHGIVVRIGNDSWATACWNTTQRSITLQSGDRISQLVIAPVSLVEVVEGLEDLKTAINDSTYADMQRGLDELDKLQSGFSQAVVQIGTELNVVENQTKIIDDTRIQLQTTLSQVQDTDYTEAITRLQKEMLGLQAAQSSFAKTSDLNLFNYIR